jgi:hypothetical protein
VAFGLATTALGTAGSANATCVSIGRISSSPDCVSDVGSAAIALGDAKATANGPMNLAVAVGNRGPNPFYPGADVPTQALAQGTFNSAFAIGSGTNAGSFGLGNSALAVGNGSNAFSYGGYGPDFKNPLPSNFNTSIVLGNRSEAGAVGRPGGHLSTVFGNGKRELNNGPRPTPPTN